MVRRSSRIKRTREEGAAQGTAVPSPTSAEAKPPTKKKPAPSPANKVDADKAPEAPEAQAAETENETKEDTPETTSATNSSAESSSSSAKEADESDKTKQPLKDVEVHVEACKS
mmetsp:Transcript_385/g.530  ORF Transcript_385/g.530 Transcript_385/m.530 type:complete len:114 (-) Transcript_385:607-948(-)